MSVRWQMILHRCELIWRIVCHRCQKVSDFNHQSHTFCQKVAASPHHINVIINLTTKITLQKWDYTLMNFALRYGGIRTRGEQSSVSKGLRPQPLGHSCIYGWYLMFTSHVMGTFGTNRIYTSGRAVRAEGL